MASMALRSKLLRTYLMMNDARAFISTRSIAHAAAVPVMLQNGLSHQRSLRRESYGELIHIDGSDHRWFEERGAACSLQVFMDDATGKLMQPRFVPNHSKSSYFDCLRGYLDAHGCSVAFYSDKHTVFRINRMPRVAPI
jgi:hypothetical protein